MRFDPADPIWPNRDRFVLSNDHASMLLWSVLHLTGTKAVNADYERLGEPSVTLGWDRYVGDSGRVIGMKTFGASAQGTAEALRLRAGEGGGPRKGNARKDVIWADDVS